MLTKTEKPKKKPKTIAQEVEAVAVILQQLVRRKAADDFGMALCVTCGKRKHWTELQGGHFISRAHIGTKVVEENIHPQCPGCNGPRSKDSLTTINYYDYMLNMYGKEFVDELKMLARKPKKFTRQEVAELKMEYSRQFRELERGLIV